MLHNPIAGKFACALLAGLTLGTAGARELTLDEAQRLAETAQPQLEARRSAMRAAGEAAAAARELPDPKLKLGFLNVPIEGAAAFTLDSEPMTMAMVGVSQEFPRQAKRELRSRVLELSGERNAVELTNLRLQLRRNAALAWLDAWIAARSLQLIASQQQEVRLELDRLVIALRNNRAGAADLSEARVALEMMRDRETVQRGEERAARVRLGRWIGDRSSALLPEELPELPRPMEAEALTQRIASHPGIESADIDARIADTEARLAHLAARPDWSMELAYGRRGSQFGDMVTVQFQLDLPILQARRQNRSVASRLAQAQAVRAMREDEARAMRADALELYVRWETAETRARAFEQQILPEAEHRLQAAMVSYRGGKGALSDVLAARRALLDLELNALLPRVEAARLAVELDYFAADGAQR